MRKTIEELEAKVAELELKVVNITVLLEAIWELQKAKDEPWQAEK
jgi:hypothetical protein